MEAVAPSPSPPWWRGEKLAYGIVIFASAFLLFLVEPLIAKLILPWFGGVAAVWAVCLLFFQVTLLLGYLYAHWLSTRVPRPFQGRVHAALLAASLLALPILPKPSLQPRVGGDPAWQILWLLTVTIGLPFFLLSATSPLLQSWYSRSSRKTSPYRLYALSNVGSLLALLAYPILVEPHFTNSHQAMGWSAAYAGIVLLCAALALWPRPPAAIATPAISVSENSPADAAASLPADSAPPASVPDPPARPKWKTQALWLSLAACGSALLLAVTNFLTQNIASVPFLWVIPLVLYLSTFILCFERPAWYRPGLILRFMLVALGGMAYALSPAYSGLPFIVLLPLFCLGLFICCMFCHGELARLKPALSHLTLFYVMVALGGALGATFVALLAPRIFSGYYELAVSLGFCVILVHVVHTRQPSGMFRQMRSPAARLLLAAIVAGFLVALIVVVRKQAADSVASVRNFYGVLQVKEEGLKVIFARGKTGGTFVDDSRYLVLVNGTIDHGLEFLDPRRRDLPTSYYGPDSGIGVVLRALEGTRPLRVGLVGLGTGTIAAYGRPGDRYTFYEINPLDIEIAHRWFHFLADSPAQIRIVPGDARLSLERESPRNYDVLAIDAFTGDSIPVHLLTLQAFQLYFRQLRPDGVLAVHISNRYLNLEPVVEAAAERLHKEAVLIVNRGDHSRGIFQSVWIVVGNSQGFEARKQIEDAGGILPPTPNDRLWTDDYSSLFRVLK